MAPLPSTINSDPIIADVYDVYDVYKEVRIRIAEPAL